MLRKRDAFREAFAGFDPRRVAAFGPEDIERLMGNAGIVRARAKIEATIRGAQIFNTMQARGDDFAAFCWSFTRGKPIQGGAYATESELSASISKELKRRGFKFVGPTIVYARMQAVGIVNDHSTSAFAGGRSRQAKGSAMPEAVEVTTFRLAAGLTMQDFIVANRDIDAWRYRSRASSRAGSASETTATSSTC